MPELEFTAGRTDTEVTLAVRLPATRDRVWRALTAPDETAAWFWPARLEPSVGFEPSPGSKFHIASAPANIRIYGEVLSLTAPGSLELSWHWAGEDRRSTVRIDLALGSDPAETALTLAHTDLADPRDVANHDQGWRDCLGRLHHYLTAEDR